MPQASETDRRAAAGRQLHETVTARAWAKEQYRARQAEAKAARAEAAAAQPDDDVPVVLPAPRPAAVAPALEPESADVDDDQELVLFFNTVLAAVVPELAGRGQPVAFDADTGRLDVVPDAPACGTQLCWSAPKLIAAANAMASGASALHVLAPAPLQAGPAAVAAEPAPQPTAPVERRTPPEGYSRALEAHREAAVPPRASRSGSSRITRVQNPESRPGQGPTPLCRTDRAHTARLPEKRRAPRPGARSARGWWAAATPR
ncbi:hypothetical protein [Streptomyces sp. NPDC006267]